MIDAIEMSEAPPRNWTDLTAPDAISTADEAAEYGVMDNKMYIGSSDIE